MSPLTIEELVYGVFINTERKVAHEQGIGGFTSLSGLSGESGLGVGNDNLQPASAQLSAVLK